MRLWEMFFCHIVILILSWRCSVVKGNSEPIDEVLDQVATATTVRQENTSANHSTLERPFRDLEITTIRYENSNGFVPITPEIQSSTTLENINFSENSLDKNFSSENHLSLFIRNPEYSESGKALEDDPFYSTEARIFLSLTQPAHNRRSSDSEDSGDDFELLKINDHTPSVANYENFYNSLSRTNQNARKKNEEQEVAQSQFYEDRRNLDRENDYFDDRARSKKTEHHSANYEGNVAAQNQRHVGSDDNQYFSYSQIHLDQNRNGYKDSSNTRNNYPSAETHNYNSQREGRTVQKFRPSPQLNYNPHEVVNSYQFEQQDTQKVDPQTAVNYHQRPRSSQNTQRSRLNVKQRHVSPKTKSVSIVNSNFEHIAPQSKTFNPSNTPGEDPPNYFEHEALFSREENNQNYEKIEETREASDENYEYIEITEKPKRFRKQRKRPSDSRDSKRLPKEHRDFEESMDIEDNAKPKTRFRPRIRPQKSKSNTWVENDNPSHEDDSDEGSYDTAVDGTINSETRKQKFYKQNHKATGNSWTNVGPNLEVSHSSGIEIDHVGKPKLVYPVKVNLVPVANFDHATALGTSQGFDLSNAVLQNFVTATPIAFNNGPPISPILNSHQSIFAKTLQNLQNHNLKVQSSVPELIVGQNTFQNPIQTQTILVPQQSYQPQYKLGQNVRNLFLPHHQNSYVQNPMSNTNLQTSNYNVVQQNVQPQNIQSASPTQTPFYNLNQNTVQNFQNPNGNQNQNFQSNLQFNNPHPTPQTFENLQQNGGQPTNNYNVQVNPHGLQGQNLIPSQNLYVPQNHASPFPTTPMPNYLNHGNQLENADINGKKNLVSGSNGQFLASASFSVGEQLQNQMDTQNIRPLQFPDSGHQAHRQDNFQPKTKGFSQQGEQPQIFPNFNNHNMQGPQIMNRDTHGEQYSQASSAIAQTYKDQNQQILKVANEIFESTLKQLKQLQRAQNLRANRLANQNSQYSEAGNTGTKNVEIINPNLSPSPVDQLPKHPFGNTYNFGGFGLTTAFPIFATTSGFDPTNRTPTLPASGPLSIHGYVDSLTEIGAKDNDLKTSPTTNLKPSPPESHLQPLYNPINFVPSLETLKIQKTLNNKYNIHEPVLQGLNLVPIIPGGTLFKNPHSTQEDLALKPKLSSDLQKYAEEMFKESLKTIYNTHKWNNDHKAQGSEISSVTTPPKVKDDLHNLKFSSPDVKPSTQILEAHFTENSPKDTERSPKQPSSAAAELADILKSDSKLPSPISLEPVRFYYKPHIHVNRPAISDMAHPDVKFKPELAGVDYIHDFLTPPKPNAFISKSPFNDPSIPFGKRRPRPKRPNFEGGGIKFHGKPENGPLKHPTGVVEPAASNIAHQTFSFDIPGFEFPENRPNFDHENMDFESDSYLGMREHNMYSRYPSLTTASPISEDYHKSTFKNLDFNHPRMHNLMGLLRKNKRLPTGNPQIQFGVKKGIARMHSVESNERNDQITHYVDENPKSIKEKSDIGSLETNANSTKTQKSHA